VTALFERNHFSFFA